MKTIKATNVNEAFPIAVKLLLAKGHVQRSQHGITLEIDEPVGVMYELPRERVLFDPVRDCNPFLGFFEALWIIAGRNDVAFLADIVATMANYSDDGHRFYGAYGHRLRHGAPGTADGTGKDRDQIKKAIDRLVANPDDRQVVMTIRDPSDMWYTGKDQPCNLMVDCKIRKGKLNISVFNRSNDTVWGMMGTNVVQFSSLQEYMAGMIGCEVGSYHQITTSMHCYQNAQWDKVSAAVSFGTDYYRAQGDDKVEPYDMMDGGVLDWHMDLDQFFRLYDRPDDPAYSWKSPYFAEVVIPMWDTLQAWKAYRRNKNLQTFVACVKAKNAIKASDWRLAVAQWMSRREYTA